MEIAPKKPCVVDVINIPTTESHQLVANHEPRVITGLCEGWGATEWTLEVLEARFGLLRFDLARGNTPVLLRDFRAMVEKGELVDEATPYIYDGGFGEKCPGASCDT